MSDPTLDRKLEILRENLTSWGRVVNDLDDRVRTIERHLLNAGDNAPIRIDNPAPPTVLVDVPHMAAILERVNASTDEALIMDHPPDRQKIARQIVNELGTIHVKQTTHLVADPMPAPMHRVLTDMRDSLQNALKKTLYRGVDTIPWKLQLDALDWCLKNVEPPAQPPAQRLAPSVEPRETLPKSPAHCSWCGKPLPGTYNAIAYVALCSDPCVIGLKSALNRDFPDLKASKTP